MQNINESIESSNDKPKGFRKESKTQRSIKRILDKDKAKFQ